MFPFDLPPHLIAQHPVPNRDESRLLVVHRQGGTLAHRHFRDLPDYLQPGDLLVLNDTRVIPARLLGHRRKTGGKWEGLFLRAGSDHSWILLCQTRGRLIEGEKIVLEPGGLELEYLGRREDGSSRWQPVSEMGHMELLRKVGHVPLPPYIRKGRAEEKDRLRYQTIYAQEAGSVAAPTAGLHFTQELFERLAQRGIETARVTLHVGWGTFQPVKVEDYRQHQMHAEWGEVTSSTVSRINACKMRGNKVIAVGTTTVRVLETAAQSGNLQPWSGETHIFIYPPYQFKVVDSLITNFHLPETTLLLLVCAFAGTDLMRRAYETAIAREYRFFSYGDAMMIL